MTTAQAGTAVRRRGMFLALAAVPDLLWALFISSGALYYAWIAAMVPLAALRFAITLLALGLWFPGKRPRGWRAAWTLELVHAAALLALIATIYADTFRHTGYARDVAPPVQALVLAWPLAMAAASVWALFRAPHPARPNPRASAV